MEANEARASRPRKMTIAEWQAEGIRVFGTANSSTWRFKCARCGQVQSVAECDAAGMEPSSAYQECIGRRVKGRGCDWALFGFLQIHAVEVVDNDGKAVPVFEFAETCAHG